MCVYCGFIFHVSSVYEDETTVSITILQGLMAILGSSIFIYNLFQSNLWR